MVMFTLENVNKTVFELDIDYTYDLRARWGLKGMHGFSHTLTYFLDELCPTHKKKIPNQLTF